MMGELRLHLIKRLLTILLLLTGNAQTAPEVAEPVSEPLVMGVFPRRPAMQTQAMFRPLADEVARALGRAVRLEVPPDFSAFWRGVEDGRFQLVHYNPYHYVRAHRELGHRLVAMNEEFGSDRIRAAIWVRQDADIATTAQLRHSRIAFGGGRDAMVSYIMAADLLARAGLAPTDYTVQFTINPTHALMAVFYRQSAAAGLNVNAFRQKRISNAVDADQLEPLLVSDPVALHPWAVNGAVNERLRERIRTALLGMKDTPAGREALSHASLTGLKPAEDADYDPHRRIVARVLGERY